MHWLARLPDVARHLSAPVAPLADPPPAGIWGLSNDTRQTGLWLAALLAIALGVRLALILFLPSLHHPDETFQYWEQGYRFAYGQGIVPWEYRVGIRSYVVPGAIAGIFRTVALLGGDAHAGRLVVQFLLAGLSLATVAVMFFWVRRAAGLAAALLAGLIGAVWFDLVFFAARPLTEAIAASLLVPATYLLLASARNARREHIAGAILLALVFVLRFHLTPTLLVLGLAFVLRHPPRAWLLPALAATGVILAAGLLDWATLGTPFQSIWLNFEINLLEGKADQFGRYPLGTYLYFFANDWAGIALIVFALAIAGARRAPLMALVALSVIVVHMLIGHKEFRFVYPALPFILALAAFGIAELVALLTATLRPRTRAVAFAATGAAIILTSVSLAIQDGFREDLTKGGSAIRAFADAGRDPNVCGLGVAGIPWHESPGYAVFANPAPLYFVGTPAELQAAAPAFNTLVFERTPWIVLPDGFSERRCWSGTCLAVRPGPCAPQPEKLVNTVLERIGQ